MVEGGRDSERFWVYDYEQCIEPQLNYRETHENKTNVYCYELAYHPMKRSICQV